MTKLLVLALCVCLVMSMSVKERLEALNENAESQGVMTNWGSYTCNPDMIGNGICELDCFFEADNFDGGDCCWSDLMGNGRCDMECDVEQLQWDGGDCPH